MSLLYLLLHQMITKLRFGTYPQRNVTIVMNNLVFCLLS
ncbi:hypothetical protein MXB_5169 [Myxobolus squamalis]|nr:hypothetical protein MXB_5169 [Myxobolus squamalis]